MLPLSEVEGKSFLAIQGDASLIIQNASQFVFPKMRKFVLWPNVSFTLKTEWGGVAVVHGRRPGNQGDSSVCLLPPTPCWDRSPPGPLEVFCPPPVGISSNSWIRCPSSSVWKQHHTAQGRAVSCTHKNLWSSGSSCLTDSSLELTSGVLLVDPFLRQPSTPPHATPPWRTKRKPAECMLWGSCVLEFT